MAADGDGRAAAVPSGGPSAAGTVARPHGPTRFREPPNGGACWIAPGASPGSEPAGDPAGPEKQPDGAAGKAAIQRVKVPPRHLPDSGA